MRGQSRPVNQRTSKLLNGLARFQPRELHKHLLRGSQLDRAILRQEFEQLHQARPWSRFARFGPTTPNRSRTLRDWFAHVARTGLPHGIAQPQLLSGTAEIMERAAGMCSVFRGRTWVTHRPVPPDDLRLRRPSKIRGDLRSRPWRDRMLGEGLQTPPGLLTAGLPF
jgi:hypothetical protein